MTAMELFRRISKPVWLIFLQCILLNSVPAISQPQPDDWQCHGQANYTANSLYQINLRTALADLSNQANKTGFYNTTVGKSPDQVYGLFLCRGDVNSQVCHDCVQAATQQIVQNCKNQKQAFMWYDACSLHYANSNFFTYSSFDQTTRGTWCSPTNYSNPDHLQQVLSTTIDGVINSAVYDSGNHGFATGVGALEPALNLYISVQCIPYLTGLQCDGCLRSAYVAIANACGLGRTRVLLYHPSCGLIYDTSPFFPLIPPPATPRPQNPTSSERMQYIAAAGIPAAFFLALLMCAIAFYIHERRRKTRTTSAAQDPNSMDAFKYSLQSIKSATSNFAIINKLGEGGFGAVFRGSLHDGAVVAVKRLSEESAQGIREFTNEVQLVAKLQHRNLVRLLGFCVEGKEKCLVYEFLPNLGLDRFLFDPKKREHLDWYTRLKIITGIARGLVYLHEDSRLKIIHRDLKSSNILLDEDMNPKIADFGIARLVKLNQTQANTSKIIGTYGYIAPEYALSGFFSVKSDVYSFGVLVLEIISGQSNTVPDQNSESLLTHALRLWNTGNMLELMDSSLSHYSEAEVLRCIQVGLLCVQEDAASRPPMASVLSMLNTSSPDLPSLPWNPPSYSNTNTSANSTTTDLTSQIV